MEQHHLLHKLHLLVHRQLHPSEDARHHALAHQLVVVKRPPELVIEPLRGRLTDVVQQRGPAQPEVVRGAAQPVDDRQRVCEVVLMADPFARLRPFQCA